MMDKFIGLKTSDNRKALINISKIDLIITSKSDPEETAVFTSGSEAPLYVANSVDEITELLLKGGEIE